MPVNALLTITGDVQGDFPGDDDGNISVFAWSHEVISPRDAASGLPTGRRQHKPLVIVKPIDAATPLLFNALTQNENLTRVTLRVLRPGGDGRVAFYQVELEDAAVAAQRSEGLNTEYADNLFQAPRETLEFTYRRITLHHLDRNIVAEDDWEGPHEV